MKRVHLLAVPHTITREDFSSCAFTGKVLRWSQMMRPYNVHVIHYGVEGAQSGASENVTLMSQDEHQQLLGHAYHDHGKGMYGDDATEGNPAYRQWNFYAREELKARVKPGDLIALPFGHAHDAAIRDLPQLISREAATFELGVGYYDCAAAWRIYESHAVRHVVMAREGRHGTSGESSRLEFVIPNYYNVDEWELNLRGGNDIVFLGRIGPHKGCDLIPKLAKARPDLRFVICGQGDPTPYLTEPNVVYREPIVGRERSMYLGNARAIIAPSRFAEPFCGVVAEAQLCGTPAITSDFGAFVETVQDKVTGFRCQTMAEWLRALDKVADLNRGYIRSRAIALWSTSVIGQKYNDALTIMYNALHENVK